MEELFKQYDRIRLRRTVKPFVKPTAEPSMEPHVEPTPDEPPWMPEPSSQNPDYNTSYEQPLSEKEKADIQRRKERDRQEEEGLRKMYKASENPNGASFEQDEEGLTKAYQDTTSPGVYYDPATHTEYIKGSATKRDWYDDFTKLPFGNTQNAERYQQAEKAHDDLQAQGKSVERVVGHSLGGSVALEMQKRLGVPRSRTFGAPVVDLRPFGRYRKNVDRYRHPLDPVSILDRGAHWGGLMSYPHTYTGFAQ